MILTTFYFFDDFANRHATEPNFNPVNKDNLDKILKAEVFVNKDGQLRAAHLILGYTPISSSFQAPKCVIKAKDPHLYRISVAVLVFLLPESVPVPEGTLTTQPIPEGVPKVAFPPQHMFGEVASSQPSSKEEDEEEERQKEVVDISDSDDLYEFFNQPLSLETSTGDLDQFFQPQSSHLKGVTLLSDEMGIKRKQRSTLQELLESQPGRDAPGKAPQTRLPIPPSAQPFQANPTDHKRKMEEKGKEVVEVGKN